MAQIVALTQGSGPQLSRNPTFCPDYYMNGHCAMKKFADKGVTRPSANASQLGAKVNLPTSPQPREVTQAQGNSEQPATLNPQLSTSTSRCCERRAWLVPFPISTTTADLHHRYSRQDFQTWLENSSCFLHHSGLSQGLEHHLPLRFPPPTAQPIDIAIDPEITHDASSTTTTSSAAPRVWWTTAASSSTTSSCRGRASEGPFDSGQVSREPR